jgi:type VI secretion system protein ImpH
MAGTELSARPRAAAPVAPATDGVGAEARAVAADATAYEFVQAMRLLERLLPRRAPVGGFANPQQEVARFTVPPSVSFPACEVQSLAVAADRPAAMAVNFLGLTGPQGVLPYFYTTYAADRARKNDAAMRDFLDIFNHRALSLFYRVAAEHHVVVAHERDGQDRLLRHLLDALGLGPDRLRGRLPVRDEGLAFYGGLLSLRGRPAQALAQLVGDYFDVPCEVEQFVGDWHAVTRPTQCALGDDGESAQLGFGAVVGDEVWDAQSRVRLRLGPLTRAAYDDFLPGGSAHEPLRALARFFTDDLLGVDVQLVLRREEAPGCVLGGDGASTAALGWGTWLHTAPPAADPDHTVLVLCA